MSKIFITVTLLIFSISTHAQNRPKLVVGIVVDQMKEDYLYRFGKHFSEDGFKKLQREGTSIKNMHYNYVPTYTGPGHASVYSGTTPAYHGIIGNNWYSIEEGQSVYCVFDDNVKSIGTTSDNGKGSPHRMLTTTITDELRLSTAMEAKVISVSIKDRGAILPAGHTGQAYWYDYSTGKFVTSSFYRDNLPDWLEKFNGKQLSEHYLNQKWDRFLSENTYIPDNEDYALYEGGFNGQETPDFPYDLSVLRKNYDYSLLSQTPFGNDILTQLATDAIEAENLGQDDVTDFLAISYSSTDIIGHNFGPQSQEIQDTYYRLDKNIADLISFLDEKVGKDNYVMFLTGDHAVADVPLYLSNQKIPAGLFRLEPLTKKLDSLTNKYFNVTGLISDISNYQIFLDHTKIREHDLELYEVQQTIADYLIEMEEYVANAWTARDIHAAPFGEEGLRGTVRRGYNQKRSGDVLFAPFPGWFSGSKTTGTTHGSPFTYDTHVPMLWYGWNIPKKTSVRYYEISDIAITLSLLLDIRMTNGSIGKPIIELFEE